MKILNQVLGRYSFLLLFELWMAEQANSSLFFSEIRVIIVMQELEKKGIPSLSLLSIMSLTSHSHIHTHTFLSKCCWFG